MGKQEVEVRRGQCPLEFKLEAVRLIKARQEAAVTTPMLNVPKQTSGNWHQWLL